MPFIVFTHSELKLSTQVVRFIRIEPGKTEDFRLGMSMGFATPVPFAAAAVETPGKIDIEPFQVAAIKPDYLVAVSRSNAPFGRPHYAGAVDNGFITHAAAYL